MSLWSKARDLQLTTLWLDGRSAGEIALALGEGLTRNAVLGRIDRMRRGDPLLFRARSTRERPRVPVATKIKAVPQRAAHGSRAQLAAARPSRASRPVGADAPPQVLDPIALKGAAWAPLPGRVPVALVDLGDGCKWPLGEPGAADFGFCGAERRGQGPYCPHHHVRAHPQPAVVLKAPSPVAFAAPSRGDRQFAGAV